MKYHQISLTAEPKIMGVSNGIHQIEINRKEMIEQPEFKDFLDFFRYKNSEFWERQGEIKDFKIPPIHAKPLKKAKITDLMGYTQNITFLDFVFSKKFVDIIKSFKIGNHWTFQVDIEGVNEPYYLLFIETIGFEKINFSKSILSTGSRFNNSIENHLVNTYSDYRALQQIHPLIAFQKISIPAEYQNTDIITTRASSLSFYSERLVDFLLDCGITNFQPRYNSSIQLDFY